MTRHRNDSACFGTPPAGRLWLRVAGVDGPRREARDRANDSETFLFIHGVVELPPREWEFTDPCLTVAELDALVKWLDSLPTSQPAKLTFTEPVLAFAWTPAGDGRGELEVRLWGEALQRDSGVDAEVRWRDGIAIPWRPTPPALAAFRDSLRIQLEQVRKGERFETPR